MNQKSTIICWRQLFHLHPTQKWALSVSSFSLDGGNVVGIGRQPLLPQYLLLSKDNA